MLKSPFSGKLNKVYVCMYVCKLGLEMKQCNNFYYLFCSIQYNPNNTWLPQISLFKIPQLLPDKFNISS